MAGDGRCPWPDAGHKTTRTALKDGDRRSTGGPRPLSAVPAAAAAEWLRREGEPRASSVLALGLSWGRPQGHRTERRLRAAQSPPPAHRWRVASIETRPRGSEQEELGGSSAGARRELGDFVGRRSWPGTADIRWPHHTTRAAPPGTGGAGDRLAGPPAVPGAAAAATRRRTLAAKTVAIERLGARITLSETRDCGGNAARERRHQTCLVSGRVTEADASNATAAKQERQSSARARRESSAIAKGVEGLRRWPGTAGVRWPPPHDDARSVNTTGTGATGRPRPPSMRPPQPGGGRPRRCGTF